MGDSLHGTFTGSWRDCTSGDQSREEPRNDFEARRTLLL